MLILADKVEGQVELLDQTQGVYDDGCVGKTLELTVFSREAIGSVKLVGYIPPQLSSSNQFMVRVGWREKQVQCEIPEMFEVALGTRIPADREVKIWVDADSVVNPQQAGINEDRRDISFLLVKLVFSPDTEVDYIKKGNQLVREGRLDEAIEAYRYAVELDADLYWSYYCLGKALSMQGKSEEALRCYRIAKNINPQFTSLETSMFFSEAL
jgi:tetratricopeptide (TPR) repeat protein